MEHEKTSSNDDDRREFLKKCGKFAAVTPPAITMLLSTTLNSDAIAKSGGRVIKVKGNNGVSKYDPQPPGNPPINDGAGTGPGNPGNKGGKK